MPAQWRNQVFLVCLEENSHDLASLLTCIDHFLLWYQLRPDQYHAFFQCAQWFMQLFKVTGLAEVKDYYDKNYHRYSLILDYFILFSTIAEGERLRTRDLLF